MYGKRFVYIILGFIAAFLLFMVISYYLYPIINPDAAATSGIEGEIYLYDYAAFGPAVVEELKKKVSSLEEQLEEKREKEMRDLAIIDSLFQVTRDLEDDLAVYERQGGGAGTGNGPDLSPAEEQRVVELSKSLMRLDEDELAPILARVSDPMLIRLYNSSNSIQREKLLRSLDPSQAAALLRRVMS